MNDRRVAAKLIVPIQLRAAVDENGKNVMENQETAPAVFVEKSVGLGNSRVKARKQADRVAAFNGALLSSRRNLKP